MVDVDEQFNRWMREMPERVAREGMRAGEVAVQYADFVRRTGRDPADVYAVPTHHDRRVRVEVRDEGRGLHVVRMGLKDERFGPEDAPEPVRAFLRMDGRGVVHHRIARSLPELARSGGADGSGLRVVTISILKGVGVFDMDIPFPVPEDQRKATVRAHADEDYIRRRRALDELPSRDAGEAAGPGLTG